MKQGKVFSFSLWLHEMRRLLPFSLSVTFVQSLFTILIPFLAGVLHTKENGGAISENILVLQPTVTFTALVISPILVFLCFSYLRHRKTSDFYDALPQTRICKSVSGLAACLCWLVVLLLVPTLVSFLLMKLFPAGFAIGSYILFRYFLSALLLGTAVGSVMFLSLHLTGTAFSGIGGFFVILFLPHVILSSASSFSECIVDYVPKRYMGFSYHPVSQAFIKLFQSENAPVFDWETVWYALIITVAAAALGIAAARFRKPERAEQKPCRAVQVAISAGLALLVFLPFLGEVFYGIVNPFEEPGLFLLVVFCSLIMLFGYLLISGHGFREMKQSLRSLAVSLVVVGLTAGLGYLLSVGPSSFSPELDEIRGVTFADYSNDIFGSVESILQPKEIELSGTRILSDREIVSEFLEAYRQNETFENWNGIEDYESGHYLKRVSVRFYMNNGSVHEFLLSCWADSLAKWDEAMTSQESAECGEIKPLTGSLCMSQFNLTSDEWREIIDLINRKIAENPDLAPLAPTLDRGNGGTALKLQAYYLNEDKNVRHGDFNLHLDAFPEAVDRIAELSGYRSAYSVEDLRRDLSEHEDAFSYVSFTFQGDFPDEIRQMDGEYGIEDSFYFQIIQPEEFKEDVNYGEDLFNYLMEHLHTERRTENDRFVLLRINPVPEMLYTRLSRQYSNGIVSLIAYLTPES